MSKKKKPKSFSSYSSLRRSINTKIERAEKAGTIETGKYAKLPTLEKGTTGMEARKAVQAAKKFKERLQRDINHGRSLKRQQTVARQKEKAKQRYQKKKLEKQSKMVLDAFQQRINAIPLPERELGRDEISGKDLIQAWFNAALVKFFPEDLAAAITETYNNGFQFQDGLRYVGRTAKNAGAFIDMLNLNLGETHSSFYDIIDQQEMLEDGDSYNI